MVAIVAAVAEVLVLVFDRRDPRGLIDVLVVVVVVDGKDMVGNAGAAVVLGGKTMDAVELLGTVVKGGKAAAVVPEDEMAGKLMGADVVAAALLEGLNRREGTDPAVDVLLVLAGRASDGWAVDELSTVLVVVPAVVDVRPGKAKGPTA